MHAAFEISWPLYDSSDHVHMHAMAFLTNLVKSVQYKTQTMHRIGDLVYGWVGRIPSILLDTEAPRNFITRNQITPSTIALLPFYRPSCPVPCY